MSGRGGRSRGQAPRGRGGHQAASGSNNNNSSDFLVATQHLGRKAFGEPTHDELVARMRRIYTAIGVDPEFHEEMLEEFREGLARNDRILAAMMPEMAESHGIGGDLPALTPGQRHLENLRRNDRIIAAMLPVSAQSHRNGGDHSLLASGQRSQRALLLPSIADQVPPSPRQTAASSARGYLRRSSPTRRARAHQSDWEGLDVPRTSNQPSFMPAAPISGYARGLGTGLGLAHSTEQAPGLSAGSMYGDMRFPAAQTPWRPAQLRTFGQGERGAGAQEAFGDARGLSTDLATSIGRGSGLSTTSTYGDRRSSAALPPCRPADVEHTFPRGEREAVDRQEILRRRRRLEERRHRRRGRGQGDAQ